MPRNDTTVRKGVRNLRLLSVSIAVICVIRGEVEANPPSGPRTPGPTPIVGEASPPARTATVQLGACCQCPPVGGCVDGIDELTCRTMNGLFQEEVSCAAAKCPTGPPPGDTCNLGAPSLASGSYPLDNRCANSDGPPGVDCGGVPKQFGADIWLNYVAPCTGQLLVRTCGATNFDSIVALYGNFPGGCVCPIDATHQLACDDNGCASLGASQLVHPIVAGRCYTIRVGGVGGAMGRGNLEIACVGPVVYVRLNAAGRNDGTSWFDALTNLDTALDIAGAVAGASGMPVQVWVAGAAGARYAPGTPGGTDRSATFRLANKVAVYGGFGGTELSLSQRNPGVFQTILTGDISLLGDETDNCRHVVWADGTDPSAILDGFTIIEGTATGPGTTDVQGGGIFVGNGSPTIVNCKVYHNTATAGGGLYNANGSPTLTNCVFATNGTRNLGSGAGLHSAGGVVIMSNCTLAMNASTGQGGGIMQSGGQLVIQNSVLSGNLALGGGPGLQDDQITFTGGGRLLHYSFVAGLDGSLGGVGNIGGSPGSDPLFVDRDGPDNLGGTPDDDFRLLPGSSCIDSGDSTVVPGDSSDTDGDGIVAEAVPVDLAGEARFMKDGRVPAAGVSDPVRAPPLTPNFPPPIVDMGAHEHKPDCNNNGTRDDLEVALGLAGDCNMNIVPDACEALPDCNQNGLSDSCDIRDGISLDCNENGFPDECEIPAVPGQYFCGAGCVGCPPVCDPDCNGNGVPDACDIKQCSQVSAAFPGCDDCNLNGVPDLCDILAGTSEDLNTDGVPDECIRWIRPADGLWSDGGNWLRGFPPLPNDFVTIDIFATAIKATLDVFAQIAGLRLGRSTTLNVNGGDLVVTSSRGIQNRGELLVANRRLRAMRLLLDGGSLRVQGESLIDLTGGGMTIDEGGRYEATDPPGTAQAVLLAEQITLLPTFCGETRQMTLRDAMRVNVSADFVMDGRGYGPCGVISAGDQGSVAGGKTPPILHINFATTSLAAGSVATMQPTVITLLNAEGFLRLLYAAEVCVGCEDTDPTFTAGVAVSEDFDNQSRFVSIYDWRNGGMVLDGGGAQQFFEVAGIDVGPDPIGFFGGQGTLEEPNLIQHTNFSMKVVEIGPNSRVTFRNQIANSVGVGVCDEALYVTRLVLRAGSSMTLDNCHVYYGNLVVEPGAEFPPTTIGCGGLVRIEGNCTLAPAPLPDMIETQSGSLVPLQMNRLLAFRAASHSNPQAVQLRFRTLPTPWDGWNGQTLWLTEPEMVCELAGIGPGGSCPPTSATYWLARTTCDPLQAHFGDWTRLGPVAIVHPGIVPGGVYELRAIDWLCDPLEDDWLSGPFSMTNPRFGDLAGPFRVASGGYTAPDGNVGVGTDVTADLSKFSNRLFSPIKARAEVEPCVQDLKINISDVTQVLDGFRNLPFPFAPGMGGCSTDPCAMNDQE